MRPSDEAGGTAGELEVRVLADGRCCCCAPRLAHPADLRGSLPIEAVLKAAAADDGRQTSVALHPFPARRLSIFPPRPRVHSRPRLSFDALNFFSRRSMTSKSPN